MDGLPALDLWNLVVEVFHSSQNQTNETKGPSAQGEPVAPGYRKPRNSKRFTRKPNLATSFPCITILCTSHGESLLNHKTDLWSGPTDDLIDLDVNTALWGKFMSVTLQAPVHLGQDYAENLRSTKNQPLKSVKLISDNWKADRRSGRDQRFFHDWLEPLYVERNISAVWWCRSSCEFQHLCLCRLSALSRKSQWLPGQSLERQNLMVF